MLLLLLLYYTSSELVKLSLDRRVPYLVSTGQFGWPRTGLVTGVGAITILAASCNLCAYFISIGTTQAQLLHPTSRFRIIISSRIFMLMKTFTKASFKDSFLGYKILTFQAICLRSRFNGSAHYMLLPGRKT